MAGRDKHFEARIIIVLGEERWGVIGPSMRGIGGSVCELGAWPKEQRVQLTEASASALAAMLNDVWTLAQSDKAREIRKALGLMDWSGEVRVAA
jgi:hypothetical protein